jgi:hypothetical protein
VQVLPAHVFLEGQAALAGIAGLAEKGRQRREVPEGDVGADIDRIRAQELGQERHRIACRLRLSVMCSPM